jgi:hypothetical protein
VTCPKKLHTFRMEVMYSLEQVVTNIFTIAHGQLSGLRRLLSIVKNFFLHVLLVSICVLCFRFALLDSSFAMHKSKSL